LNSGVDEGLMDLSTSYAGVGERPVIYAGRFIDQVADVKLPSHYRIRGEGHVRSQFSAVVDEATTLIVLDPHSFPFEAMAEDQWDVPLVVVLPSGFDDESLTATFGASLFERLEFFDRIGYTRRVRDLHILRKDSEVSPELWKAHAPGGAAGLQTRAGASNASR
jgi:hypothetical protein